MLRFLAPTPLRVLIIDSNARRADAVASHLAAGGVEAIVVSESAFAIRALVEEKQPDAVVISTESPSRDVLEELVIMRERNPRPIVMFTGDRERGTIKQAIRAGVTAYVVDGLETERVEPILRVAMERFAVEQDLKRELRDARSQLAERKTIERAKGIVMKSKGLPEPEAYALMRKIAMQRGKKLVEIAEGIIDIADAIT